MKRTLFLTAVAVLMLAGGAFAGSQITGAQVKNSSLTGKDIKNKSLTKKDFKGSVRGRRGATGATGAAGPAGPGGPQGPAGATGVAEIVSAQGEGTGVAIAYCPEGTRPLSGGGQENGDGYIWASGAAQDEGGIGWVVAGNDASPMVAFAYCSAGVSKFTFPDGTVRSGHSGLLDPAKLRAQARRR